MCGAGTMGRGIAQLAAQSGFETVLFDLEQLVLDQASITLDQNLQSQVEKGRLTAEEKKQISARIRYTSNFADCKSGMIIEAIVENLSSKIDLFNRLSAINNIDTIFATNTSSISVSEIARSVEAPERVVGMHFFNPAPIMRLIEVVQGDQTSTWVTETVLKIGKQMKKTTVICRDSPGFIVNRVARPFYLEALRFIESLPSPVSFASFELVDKLLESSGFKLGPFKLMDLIGNDINFAVSNSVYEQLGKPPRLKPSFIQKGKVEKGELGRKSGKGYYDYTLR